MYSRWRMFLFCHSMTSSLSNLSLSTPNQELLWERTFQTPSPSQLQSLDLILLTPYSPSYFQNKVDTKKHHQIFFQGRSCYLAARNTISRQPPAINCLREYLSSRLAQHHILSGAAHNQWLNEAGKLSPGHSWWNISNLELPRGWLVLMSLHHTLTSLSAQSCIHPSCSQMLTLRTHPINAPTVFRVSFLENSCCVTRNQFSNIL